MDQTDLPTWPRDRFVSDGGDALLCYRVYGNLELDRPLSRSKYRCAGIPAGLEMRRIEHGSPAMLEPLAHPIAGVLRQGFALLDQELRESRNAVVMLGAFGDPSTLDYFRDTIGLITWTLDCGGRFVYDPQQLRCWSAEAWRTEVFEAAGPVPLRHCVILVSDEGDGTRWYHTRGLRQYGRPDISIHRVPERFWPGAVEICERFIEHFANGATAVDGQEIRVGGFPRATARNAGSLDDPDFNNRHIEVTWSE